MKAIFLSLLLVVPAIAQFRPLQVLTSYSTPTTVQRVEPSARIKGIQRMDQNLGIAFTDDAIYRTVDGGSNWDRLALYIGPYQTLSAATLVDRESGYAIIAGPGTRLQLLQTNDGGGSWDSRAISLAGSSLDEIDLNTGEIVIAGDGIEISFRLVTSSNFSGRIKYVSNDGGETWRLDEKSVELKSSDEIEEQRSGSWTLKTEGTCAGYKTGCVVETRIITGGNDITPSKIQELNRIAKEKAMTEAVPMFMAPPGGSTRISLSRGFDKCQAGTTAQMQLWWDNSYFHDTNIYMSGRNRACPSQPFTNNPAWINTVSAQGWGFIPTIVGYQSPCTASATTVKFSYDVAVAEQQGRGEADIAVNDANSIGLTAGSVLYYDMERYDPPIPDTLGCRPATIAFLKGWTERIHELGYVSGVYGSPTNAVPDWWPMPAASRMDAIWMARWDNVMSVWTYNAPSPAFPSDAWINHQRIKQWQAPHNETWGGVTFNIDGNIADGPVAGAAVPRNRRADFDGDLKTDISVFRPDNGVWYIQKSNGTGYIINAFGLSTDIPTPGDYEGDGKTDLAVFRPSDGVWHMLTKGSIYSARAFGANGDIPAAADYNGDGKTDLALFRPSNGVWYIANSDSLGTYTIVQFGLGGDVPVTGDYDGDGKSDIAVWRPSSGVWYVSRSSDSGFTALAFGISTDRPAEGDFDGDGKSDFAVLRDGTWYLMQTTAGFSQFNFGAAGDLPVTGDFDGDNKSDAAVFRSSNGVWYLLQSQNGFYAQQFGVAGDKPIPNAYLPQ